MDNLIIIEGQKKHFLYRLLASFLFATAVFVLGKFFLNTPISNTESFRLAFLKLIKSEVYILIFAIGFSVVSHHHFNLKEKKYREYFSVANIGYGKWKSIDNLSYTSVFLNSKDIYEVNIWDESNNRFKVYFYNKEIDAIETAKHLAKKLNISYYSKNG